MVFMVYKPKAAKNVRAEQLLLANADELAATFFGTARVDKFEDESIVTVTIATLDGPITAEVGQWIVRTDGGITVMDDKDFDAMYERARVVGRDS